MLDSNTNIELYYDIFLILIFCTIKKIHFKNIYENHCLVFNQINRMKFKSYLKKDISTIVLDIYT